jgi:hypothetical protein
VVSSTRTRYAKSGDVDIAYQVLGDGPIDLLVYTGSLIPIDCVDEEPSMAPNGSVNRATMDEDRHLIGPRGR